MENTMFHEFLKILKANTNSNSNTTEQRYFKEGGKWIQKATDKMEKSGTAGSFRKYCGGKVTMECINKGLRSPDPTIRKRAQFAKTMMNLHKKAMGGMVTDEDVADISGEAADKAMKKFSEANEYNTDCEVCPKLGIKLNNTNDDIIRTIEVLKKVDETGKIQDTDIKISFKDKKAIYDYLLKNKNVLKELGIDTEELERATLVDKKFNSGGSYNTRYDKGPLYGRYQEGGSYPETSQARPTPQEQPPQQQAQQGTPNAQSGYDITYEQYVEFIMQDQEFLKKLLYVLRYPEYLSQFLSDIQKAMQQQSASGNQGQAPNQSMNIEAQP